MEGKYKRPLSIKLEELAFRYFSDYFKPVLNKKEDTEYILKMLKQIFL